MVVLQTLFLTMDLYILKYLDISPFPVNYVYEKGKVFFMYYLKLIAYIFTFIGRESFSLIILCIIYNLLEKKIDMNRETPTKLYIILKIIF